MATTVGYSSPGVGPNVPTGGSGGSSNQDAGYSTTRLRRMYLDFAGSKRAEIDEQRTARHYYHGDQWTSEEVAIQKKRGQPVTTNNVVGRKIDGVVGLIEKLRQDPKAYPRTPNQEDGAEVATEALRYVLDAEEWQPKSAESARAGGINGISGIELELIKGDKGDPDIGFNIVDSETFFYDPRSVRYDFSDARFMGVAKWVDLEVAQEMFPGQADMLSGLIDYGGGGMESWQQQDREQRWIDVDLKRLFLIEQWYQKAGGWQYCFYVATTEIKSGSSLFYNEKGKQISRYVMYSVNIDHDGDRYGFIRNLKSAQDEINARRSKALHILNVRRIIMDEGAVKDVEKARREAVRPDGVIVKNKGYELEFDDQAKLADLEGQLKFLEEAKTTVENFGPNPALIGQGIENKSGRAISLLQQAGIAELGPFILAYRGWKIRVYRAIWNAVQRYWTKERWLRVTDDEGGAQFVPLNQLQMDQYGRPQIVNNLGALDVDIILDEGPDTMNLMQDTFDILQTLAQNGVPVPPQVFLELSQIDSRTKKKVIALLSQPDPMKQVQQDQLTANVQKTQAETAKIKTDAAANVHNVLHEVASQGVGESGPAPVQPRPPSQSINFADLPPEAQSQMLAEVGITIHPAILAAHAAQQAKATQAAKAASRQAPQSVA